jgi:hypothetical protein
MLVKEGLKEMNDVEDVVGFLDNPLGEIEEGISDIEGDGTSAFNGELVKIRVVGVDIELDGGIEEGDAGVKPLGGGDGDGGRDGRVR